MWGYCRFVLVVFFRLLGFLPSLLWRKLQTCPRKAVICLLVNLFIRLLSRNFFSNFTYLNDIVLKGQNKNCFHVLFPVLTKSRILFKASSNTSSFAHKEIRI